MYYDGKSCRILEYQIEGKEPCQDDKGRLSVAANVVSVTLHQQLEGISHRFCCDLETALS